MRAVVHIAHIVGRKDFDTFLCDDVAGVYFMLEEESRDPGLRVSVDDSPVDRGCATVAREQRSVEIECAEARHSPYHFRKHAEGDDDKQVGVERT